jgi:long-chain fatty acid transport protein
MQKFYFSATSGVFSLILLFGENSGHGAVFQIWAQSANSIAYAHADMAALADDATTAWYNPAGMTELCSPQVAATGTFTFINSAFRTRTGFGDQLAAAANSDANVFAVFLENFSNAFQYPRSVGNASPPSGSLSGAYPFQWGNLKGAFGLAVAGPWGIELDWRYSQIAPYTERTYVYSFQINPSFAVGYGPFSVAAGYGAELMKTHLTATLNKLGAYFVLSSWENTWNVAGLYQFSSDTQFGITYRPAINHYLKGRNKIYTLSSDRAHAVFRMPSTLTTGFKTDLTSCLSLLGTFGWSRWSRMQSIEVFSGIQEFIASPVIITAFGDDVLFDSDVTYVNVKAKDTFLVALGTKYVANSQWTLKFGVAWDSSAIQPKYRNLHIPDTEHFHFGMGARCDFNSFARADIGFQYIFVPKCGIRQNPYFAIGTVIVGSDGKPIPDQKTKVPRKEVGYFGTLENSAMLFSLQVSVLFP